MICRILKSEWFLSAQHKVISDGFTFLHYLHFFRYVFLLDKAEWKPACSYTYVNIKVFLKMIQTLTQTGLQRKSESWFLVISELNLSHICDAYLCSTSKPKGTSQSRGKLKSRLMLHSLSWNTGPKILLLLHWSIGSPLIKNNLGVF